MCRIFIAHAGVDDIHLAAFRAILGHLSVGLHSGLQSGGDAGVSCVDHAALQQTGSAAAGGTQVSASAVVGVP
jgi:hypothetical protein